MTSGEMVTTFACEKAKIAALIDALNAYLKQVGLEAEEYNFSLGLNWKYDDPDATVPAKARWLIAFAVEGSSEGYYVHVGALAKQQYTEFGIAKMNSAENAYAIAKESQRFLTAARWN